MKFNDRFDKAQFIAFLDNFLPADFTEKEEDIIVKNPRYKEITTAKSLGYSESVFLNTTRAR